MIMKPLNSIRKRLVLAAFVFACLVAGIFSIGLTVAFDTAEDKLFDDHMRGDVDAFMAAYQQNRATLDIPRQNFAVFAAPTGTTQDLPHYLQDLAATADEVIIDGAEFDLQIRTSGDQTLYFLFDESEFEEFERQLLVAMLTIVAIVIGGSTWAGAMIANRIIRPLSNLARQVSDIGHDYGSHIALDTEDASDEEILKLASAINGYHNRVTELLQREREFSSDVSHELRTPIMAIQGAAEILHNRYTDTQDAKEPIIRIKRNCFHMTTITEALLYLARDPATFQDMVEPVSIKHVVDGQIAAVRDVVEKKGITVNVAQDADTIIHTIPAVVEIVIGNILKNAVKYTNKNVINIFVEKDEVVIQDYGPGIDRSTQATLFDRFNRGHNRNPDGSGIGLALVRRFCEQYGWGIDFKSDRKSGTRVAVAF